MQQVTLLIKRGDHYEAHFSDRVEFWTLDLQRQLGTANVHKIR